MRLAPLGLAQKPKIQLKIRRYLQTSGGDAEVLLQSFQIVFTLFSLQLGEKITQLCQLQPQI